VHAGEERETEKKKRARDREHEKKRERDRDKISRTPSRRNDREGDGTFVLQGRVRKSTE